MRIPTNVLMEPSNINNTQMVTSHSEYRNINNEPLDVSTAVSHNQKLEMNDETTAKIKEAVTKMNEMLAVNNSTSKFLYHEGLNRYYVTVVDKNTEEVVKEIPPKKLLDAFYEMQKMLGMVVDEKI